MVASLVSETALTWTMFGEGNRALDFGAECRVTDVISVTRNICTSAILFTQLSPLCRWRPPPLSLWSVRRLCHPGLPSPCLRSCIREHDAELQFRLLQEMVFHTDHRPDIMQRISAGTLAKLCTGSSQLLIEQLLSQETASPLQSLLSLPSSR